MPSFKKDKSKEADKGKEAEKAVQDVLDALSADHADLDYLRLPDARACMGRARAMPADYEVFAPGLHGLLEVKETTHDFRVARAKVTQLPMMRKRVLAGGKCYLVVHHSTLGKWRLVPVQLLDPTASSWDLSEFALHDNPGDMLAWITTYCQLKGN